MYFIYNVKLGDDSGGDIEHGTVWLMAEKIFSKKCRKNFVSPKIVSTFVVSKAKA